MKLFVGIELPRNIKTEAERMLSELKKVSSGNGRFEPADRMHITLCYLGETGNMAGAVSAMRRAVEGIRPFPLHLGEYAYFGRKLSDAKTSYISVKGDLHELNMLYYALTAALSDEGFSTSAKGYTPHLTLGRNVLHDDEAAVSLSNITPPLNASMSVNQIVLFESTKQNGIKKYIPIHRENFT